jgi:hypothetical protein
MNDPSQNSILDRSPVARFIRWLRSWRGIRCILILLAWAATVIALFYGEENWRGWHGWSTYRKNLEARGEQLDFRAFIPKPVPDEQNFAATPFVKSWFEKRGQRDSEFWEDNYDQASRTVARPNTNREKAERRLLDLVAWERAFAASRTGKLNDREDVEENELDPGSRAKAGLAILAEFKPDEVVFAELRAASRRPLVLYPVKYEDKNPWAMLLPHLAQVKAVCLRLQLKACAELAAGQSENALEDAKLALYLADSARGEPFLISHLVRIACLQITTQPIWEGLAAHRWSEPQLEQLQTHLQQYSFLTDMKRPLDLERAAAVLTVDLIRERGLGYLNDLSSMESPSPGPSSRVLADLLGRLVPRGWYYQEQLSYCRLFQIGVGGGLDAANQRVSPSQTEAAARELERALEGDAGTSVGRDLSAILHHRIIARMMLPALTKVTRKSAVAQTVANQAALACALERCRLAQGEFPEKLEALAPRFTLKLPNDVLTGQPFKYRRTEDGQFVLYSIGWDEKDGGGVPGKVLYDEQQGDWVWRYPSMER